MFEHFEVTITPFNRKRLIRVYLPEDYYKNTEKKYPVLYMHDGQNLYKNEDAAYGMSWGISEFLDSSDIELIVVGIDNNVEGYKRLDEYAPWVSPSMSTLFPDMKGDIGGEGKEYIDYIAKELKPLIDNKYRTLPEATSMIGSSMGGLISTYAACAYPEIFKRIASVSSAYWFNQDDIENLIKQNDLSMVERFYLDVGTKESTESINNQRYIDSSQVVYDLLKDKVQDCKFVIAEGAVHNEDAWRKRVPEIFAYLYK